MARESSDRLIDLAIQKWKDLRSLSRYEDCSDRPSDEVTEVVFTLVQAIEIAAGTNSPEHKTASEALASSGPNNPYLLTVLPGIVKSLRNRGPIVAADSSESKIAKPNPKKVFVIHGRNDLARRALFSFLRAVGLEPLEWNQAVSLSRSGSPYIGDVLDSAFAHAQAILVLLTGDDLARLGARFLNNSDPSYERDLTPQPRPNVIFEAGMALGRKPERTILVALGNSRPFSDIGGRYVIALTNAPQSRHTLADRLRATGCTVDTAHRTDWIHEGDFDSAIIHPDYSDAAKATRK